MSEPLGVLVFKALRDHLETPAISTPATPIAWPFTAYEPVSGTPYYQVSDLRGEPQQTTVGNDEGGILYRGIFQVDAVVPDNRGEPPGLRLAWAVAERFAPGKTFYLTGGFRLKITQPATISGALKADPPWVRFPVSIPWWVFA